MITIDVLTVPEQHQLNEQETRIEQGFRAFFAEVGDALQIIRDKRLYRAGYKNFEDYCRARWGVSDNYAHKLISAAETIGNLKSANVATLPATESQARELTRLKDPEDQVEAWLNSVRNAPNGKPNAEQVKLEVEQVRSEIERVTQRSMPITPGSKAQVLAGEHEGKEVEVQFVEKGAIAHSKLPGGDMYPFMVGEIRVTEVAPPAATPANTQKPKVDLKTENQQLKALLAEILEVAEMPESLRERAEGLL
jgi:hypothetical protein